MKYCQMPVIPPPPGHKWIDEFVCAKYSCTLGLHKVSFLFAPELKKSTAGLLCLSVTTAAKLSHTHSWVMFSLETYKALLSEKAMMGPYCCAINSSIFCQEGHYSAKMTAWTLITQVKPSQIFVLVELRGGGLVACFYNSASPFFFFPVKTVGHKENNGTCTLHGTSRNTSSWSTELSFLGQTHEKYNERHMTPGLPASSPHQHQTWILMARCHSYTNGSNPNLQQRTACCYRSNYNLHWAVRETHEMIFFSLFLTLQIQDETWPTALIPQPGLLRESLHWPWVLWWSVLWASVSKSPVWTTAREKIPCSFSTAWQIVKHA